MFSLTSISRTASHPSVWFALQTSHSGLRQRDSRRGDTGGSKDTQPPVSHFHSSTNMPSKQPRSRRPPRNAPAPAPSTLSGGEPPAYCHTCGRIMSHRKSSSASTPQKYCSDRCRRERPRPGKDPSSLPIEQHIEDTFVSMLGDGEGESRGRIVACSQVEQRLFPRGVNEYREIEEGHGEQDTVNSANTKANDGNNASPANPRDGETPDNQASSSEDESLSESNGVPLPQSQIGFSSPPNQTGQQPITSTAASEPTTPREAGLLRARRREMVRQAARRGVAFGFLVNAKDQLGAFSPHEETGDQERPRRKVEAVQRGRVVETSFAKGEWGVRWP